MGICLVVNNNNILDWCVLLSLYIPMGNIVTSFEHLRSSRQAR